MNIREQLIEDVTVFEVAGKVVLPEEAQLREVMREAIAQGARKILFDLGKVRVMDSSGVGTLMAAYTSAKNAGAEVKLCSLSKKLLDILQMVELHLVFEILTTRTDGIEAFREKAHHASAAS